MPGNEDPVSVLRALIDAMNRGERRAGLKSMTEDVVIIDDVPPFRRAGRQEAERWFERLSVARERVEASLTLEKCGGPGCRRHGLRRCAGLVPRNRGRKEHRCERHAYGDSWPPRWDVADRQPGLGLRDMTS